MQSLNAKFNGMSQKVVDYARNFGILEAMEEFKVKDYIAMLNFLNEASPDENFQVAKVEVDSYAMPDAFDKLLQAMLRKFKEQESKITNLEVENIDLKRQVEYYKVMKWNKTSPLVQDLFKYCEGDENAK